MFKLAVHFSLTAVLAVALTARGSESPLCDTPAETICSKIDVGHRNFIDEAIDAASLAARIARTSDEGTKISEARHDLFLVLEREQDISQERFERAVSVYFGLMKKSALAALGKVSLPVIFEEVQKDLIQSFFSHPSGYPDVDQLKQTKIRRVRYFTESELQTHVVAAPRENAIALLREFHQECGAGGNQVQAFYDSKHADVPFVYICPAMLHLTAQTSAPELSVRSVLAHELMHAVSPYSMAFSDPSYSEQIQCLDRFDGSNFSKIAVTIASAQYEFEVNSRSSMQRTIRVLMDRTEKLGRVLGRSPLNVEHYVDEVVADSGVSRVWEEYFKRVKLTDSELQRVAAASVEYQCLLGGEKKERDLVHPSPRFRIDYVFRNEGLRKVLGCTRPAVVPACF